MKLFLFSLILLCYALLVLTRPSPRVPNQYSYLLNQVSKPYTNVFKVLHDKASTNLKHLKAYIEKDTKTPSLKEKEPEYIIIVPDTEAKENNISIDSEDAITGRMLANPCKNNGQYLPTDVNVYKCGTPQAIVTKATYESLKDQTGTNCAVTQSTLDQCYCSYETYGDLCESTIAWTCEIERVSHPPECTGEDTYNYVYSDSGSPPCYEVEAGQTITFVTKATCTFSDTTFAFEGVKPSRYEVRSQPTTSAAFTYEVENDNFKLQTLPTNTKQQVTFTNWKYMSFPALWEIDITGTQLAGMDVISGDMEFPNWLEEYAYSGRYYYETFIVVDKTQKNYKYAGGFFEQAGYVEPPPKKEKSNTAAIVVGIIAAVVVVTVIIGYNLYQNRKNRRHQVDVQPLVESWE